MATRSESVITACIGRVDDVSGVWKNVGNEGVHAILKKMSLKKNGKRLMHNLVIDLNVKQLHANLTVGDNLISTSKELFDNLWIDKFVDIQYKFKNPPVLKQIEEDGVCVDWSDILSSHIDSVKDMMQKRDIVIRHSQYTRKQDRNMFTKEICARSDIHEITINVITHFQTKYNKSINVIIKELQKHGIPSGKMDDGTLVTSRKNIPKLYQLIGQNNVSPLHHKPITSS